MRHGSAHDFLILTDLYGIRNVFNSSGNIVKLFESREV